MDYGFERPSDFEFLPGQKITFDYPAPVRTLSRDYTLINSCDDDAYDFYLCGRGEMVAEAVHIIDDRFPGSLVFSEPFF